MRNSKISIVKVLLLGIAMLMLGSSSVLAQVSVTLPTVTKLSGSPTDTLEITTGDLTGQSVRAFEFSLYYNTSVVQITNALKAGVSDVSSALFTVNADTANGVLHVAFASGNTISGSGTLVKIVVSYKNIGTSSLSFNNTFMFNAGTPAATITNGSITIPQNAVSFGNMNALVGDTIDIPIETSALTSSDAVMAYDFIASYNSSVLKILGVDKTNTLSSNGIVSANVNYSTNKIKIAFASGSTITASSGDVLIYVKAVAVAAGKSTLSFDNFEFNNGTPNAGGVSGTVNVTALTTYSISGIVSYQNSGNSPLSGVTVTLTPASGSAKTATSDASGAYSFTGLMAGTYTISASSTGTWGSVNAADALLAARYYNGLTTLDALQLKAGDVNGNGQVNNTDALDIVKRYVGQITSFAIGDWVFSPSSASVTITNANVTDSIKALVAGDINESYNPASPKQFALNLVSGSELNIKPGDSFEVPISVANNMQVGAVSIKMSYPKDIAEFSGISVNGKNVFANEKNGVISIAWADLTGGKSPLNLKTGSILATIKFTANKGLSNGSRFDLGLLPGSEFVNANGAVINNASIMAPEASVSQPSEFTLKQNYPNPFNPSTTIDYSIPADGNVTITIYNVTGQQVAKLVNGVQNAGSHRIVWNASNLSSGIYFYQINFNGPNKKFTDVKSMVLLK